MAPPRPRPFWLSVLLQGARFLYLLWGGMLLCTLTLQDRVRFPDVIWHWPAVVRFLSRPWGRGLMLGLGLVLCLAALLEIWELVDKLLGRLMKEHERDH